MNYETLENNFNVNGVLKFRLYSLEYIIIKKVNDVEVYAILYPSDKKVFTSFYDAMYNYTVFNASLYSYMNRIKII